VSIRRGWPAMSSKLLVLCKMIDKRDWPSATPLRQACHIKLFVSSKFILISFLL
jgi:hypothetical protein